VIFTFEDKNVILVDYIDYHWGNYDT
jgi:hypothetical protein